MSRTYVPGKSVTPGPSRLDVAVNTVAVFAVAGIVAYLFDWVPEFAARERTDFGAFWSSGVEPFYGSPGRPNRNNPHTTVLLFSPFWSLPLARAWTLYSLLHLAATLGGVALAVRAVRAPWWSVAPVFLVFAGTLHGWGSFAQGQLTGPLLLLIGGTWYALERGLDRTAGAVLGIALAFKVFIALPVACLWLARRRTAAVTAVLVAAALYLAGLLVAPGLYVEHVQMLAAVEVSADMRGNYALAAVEARFGWPLVWLVPVVAGAVLLGSWRARTDVALALGLVGMLLIGPLSWFYYLPLALPALLVLWRRGRPWLGAAAWLVFSSPYFGMPTFGLMGFLGVLLLIRRTEAAPARRAPTVARPPSAPPRRDTPEPARVGPKVIR